MSRVRLSICCLVGTIVLVAGCHREVQEDIPSGDKTKITIADRFYDVVALDKNNILVVGYAGKILRSEDAGYSWQIVNSGTDKALYAVHFANANNGWIVGQDGLILHSADAGKTWERQTSGATVYLFSVDFVSPTDGWAVGDKATYVHTTDGGQHWSLGKLAGEEGLTADEALLAQEPVLYGVEFADPQNGWIVGEFGSIYHTVDGGQTWKTQQESLIGGEGIFDTLDIPTFFGVSLAGAQNGVVAGLETKIARTRDSGAKWKFEPFENKQAGADPLYQPFQFPDTTAWAVGAAGAVYHQRSVGEPWLRVSLGREVNTWLRGVYFLDKDDGWVVGGYGHILHTTDGGQTWLQMFG